MECNKEEAIRAKGIAEMKMQNKDFVGAHRMALRAQQIFPDLENILQMLAVCNVHCAAERKILGNEMDWYGILQVEQTADEALIKKQYRKFALLLHPDKNKFAGAEAAFKLIGEAQRVLLDREKRSFHDMKRRASIRPAAPNRPPQQASRNLYVGKQPGVQNNFRSNTTSPYMGLNPQHQQSQQQAQPGLPNDRRTFWTACPSCGMKYQYYIETFKKSLICQTCKKSFIAHDMNAQGAPLGTNVNQPAFHQQNLFPRQGASNRGLQSTFENPTSDVKFHGNVGSENSKPGSRKVNGKRGRREVEDSSESSTESEEDAVIEEDGNLRAGKNFGFYRDEYPRRSTRHKHQVSYDENLSDNDERPSKKVKASGLSCASEEESQDVSLKGEAANMNKQAGLAADVKEVKEKAAASFDESSLKGSEETKKLKGKQTVKEDGYKKSSEADGHSTSNSSPKTTPDPEFYDCPDPDFSDFDKDREEEYFKVGQVWAVYDTVDAMPRFYARIIRVFSAGFKLRITWLEPDPDDEDKIKWVNEDLPVSCGKFKNGHSENTEDRLMFSHVVCWEKGSW
ncbi:hypothetical protein L1049_016152 [Liquidambar formosana]|uniref:J domain-containing protein n=1 Tax=Liquidambar formosana TaxID=63359 RepID=A0AAP0S0T3_LIQFO